MTDPQQPDGGDPLDRRQFGRRALERLMTFGDAVVAIAITLIVLPLVEAAMEAHTASAFFARRGDTLVAAALSFVVVAVTWHAHHRAFIAATGYNRPIFWSEVVWLAAEVFLPVATVLDILGAGVSRTALGIYVGDLLVIVTTIRFQIVVLERSGLAPVSHTPMWVRWHLVVTWCVVLALSLLFPRVGASWIFLVLIDAVVTRVIGRPRSTGSGRSQDGSGVSSGPRGSRG